MKQVFPLCSRQTIQCITVASRVFVREHRDRYVCKIRVTNDLLAITDCVVSVCQLEESCVKALTCELRWMNV